jgi:hypothetical protein
MSASTPHPKNDPQEVFLKIFSELAAAEGHHQIYADINQAREEQKPELMPFIDFFEMTMMGHLAGTILSTTRILDRSGDTASILWLLRYIENQPGRFGDQTSALSDIRGRLDRSSELIQKVRRIRNKKIAHLERMSKDHSVSFWSAVGLTFDEMTELLSLLRFIMKDIERILWPQSGCGYMFAVENETSDVFEALRFAFANGHTTLVIDPSFFEQFRQKVPAA